jgi:uncharacterized membrane protein YedE/YeeE
MLPVIIACLLAVVLGFAAHRSSICTVRAVAEVLSARTGYMFASIAKSVLWVMLIALPVIWIAPAAGAGLGGWPLTAAALLGGFAFGIGAAVNGACAYSTMARLVDGEGAMLVAIAGFALGVFGFASLAGSPWLSRPTPTPALIGSLIGWVALLSLPLLIWAVYEAVRLWRTRGSAGLRHLILARQYRLSTAAVLIGGIGALVFLLLGNAGYSSTFELVIEGLLGTRPYPGAARWAVALCVLLGMLLSTLERRSFRLDLRPRRAWWRNLVGGALMGFGVALAPGGNDVLVLYGLPSLSPHALPTFAAMLLGIALALLALRAWFGVNARVRCENDLFVGDSWTPPIPARGP